MNNVYLHSIFNHKIVKLEEEFDYKKFFSRTDFKTALGASETIAKSRIQRRIKVYSYFLEILSYYKANQCFPKYKEKGIQNDEVLDRDIEYYIEALVEFADKYNKMYELTNFLKIV